MALVLSWYSLGCSLLGQGSTNLDTGCQEKTSWIRHPTLITASVTCTGERRMGTPELGSRVVYFNELLRPAKEAPFTFVLYRKTKGGGRDKALNKCFLTPECGKQDWAHHKSRQVWGTGAAKNCLLPPCVLFLSPKSNQVILGKKRPGLGKTAQKGKLSRHQRRVKGRQDVTNPVQTLRSFWWLNDSCRVFYFIFLIQDNNVCLWYIIWRQY